MHEICVIGEDKDLVYIIRTVLEKNGFNCVESSWGESNGRIVVVELVNEENLVNVLNLAKNKKVILIASISRWKKRELLENGLIVLEKPFSLKELVKVVKEIKEKKRWVRI